MRSETRPASTNKVKKEQGPGDVATWRFKLSSVCFNLSTHFLNLFQGSSQSFYHVFNLFRGPSHSFVTNKVGISAKEQCPAPLVSAN